MSAQGPDPLSSALSELISARGLARARGESQLADAWRQAAGEACSQRTRPLGLRRGVLQVAVDSAPLRSELQSFRRAELLHALQEAAPHLNVRDLKFVLKRS